MCTIPGTFDTGQALIESRGRQKGWSDYRIACAQQQLIARRHRRELKERTDHIASLGIAGWIPVEEAYWLKPPQ